jgi:hypothetical protein
MSRQLQRRRAAFVAAAVLLLSLLGSALLWRSLATAAPAQTVSLAE